MSHNCHIRPAVTRRDVLVRAAHGFGSLALASLLDPPAHAADRVNPLAAKPPQILQRQRNRKSRPPRQAYHKFAAIVNPVLLCFGDDTRKAVKRLCLAFDARPSA